MKLLVLFTCSCACACALVVLTNCGNVRVEVPRAALPSAAPMGPAAPTAAERKLDALQDDLAATQAREAELRSKIKVQDKIVADEAWRWAHVLIHWVAALAIIVGLLAAGAGVYFRCKALLGIAAASAAVVVAAFVGDWLVTHRVLAMVAVLALTAGALAMLWRHAHKQAKLARLHHGALGAAMKAIAYLNPKGDLQEVQRAKQRVVDEIMGDYQAVVAKLGPAARFSGALPAIDQLPPSPPTAGDQASSPPTPGAPAG